MGGAGFTPGVAPWSNAQPSDRAYAEEAWQRSRESGQPFSVEFRLWKPTGEAFWVGVSTQQLADNTGFIGTAHDVTDSVNRRVLSNQLIGLLDSSVDAVIVFDPRGELLFVNHGARTLIGVSEHSATTDAATQLFIQAIRDQVPREVVANPANNTWEGELGFRSPDGIMRTLALTLHIVREADGAVQHFSVIARDITEAKQVQDELAFQATHDALTGLPNRVLFLRKLSEALERSITLKRGVGVLFVDLDKLKDVNDNIGHNVGDQLLNTIAKRLASATRPSDIVARIGGDEFVVLCDGLGDEHVAMDVAERVRQAMTGQVILQGIEIFTSASIGIALATPALLAEQAPKDAAVTLFNNADTAMYRAKESGRNCVAIFDESMLASVTQRLAVETALYRALERRELRLVHQPIIDVGLGEVVGFEALMRWDRDDGSSISPAEFIPIAEETGTIVPIGAWALLEALTHLGEWIASGVCPRDATMAVNVSPRQLSDPNFVNLVSEALTRAHIPARQLWLEVTEGVMIAQPDQALDALTKLCDLGVRVAIDDFGTGYSSLSLLQKFPIHCLKIDRSFISGVADNADARSLVRTIIAMCESMGLDIVAEGVESVRQLQVLGEMRCAKAQGYLISHPVPPESIASTVATINDLGPWPRTRRPS